MMENSVYSVITPEGCAAILWKNAERSADAAECLKLTADYLKEGGLIDEIIARKNLSGLMRPITTKSRIIYPNLTKHLVKQMAMQKLFKT